MKRIFCLLAPQILRMIVFGVILGPSVVFAESYRNSPYHFMVELKFSPYLPSVDKSNSPAIQNGATPFSDIFGDPNAPKGADPSRGLLTEIEFDYQFLHHVTGSLGVGLSVGYYRTSGHPFVATSGAAGAPQLCQTVNNPIDGGPRIYVNGTTQLDDAHCRSGDNTFFNVFPLNVLFVYRFEYFQNRWRVPIIPYIKVGFSYWFWWIGNDDSIVGSAHIPATDTSPGNNSLTSGGTAGLVFHPGVAFDLGGIDIEAGKTLARETGVHRVTLFIELNAAWINNFGISKPTVNLSDIMFNAGLGFEF